MSVSDMYPSFRVRAPLITGHKLNATFMLPELRLKTSHKKDKALSMV